jgi:hypothetical protein
MLKLNSTWQCLLLNQPESGMGYQIVEATTFDNKIKRGVVYNAELLLFEEEPRFRLLAATFQQLLEAAKVSKDEIKSLQVVTNAASPPPTFALREAVSSYGKKVAPAKDAPIAKTRENEVFKRFTAYEKDHRITSDGRLRPGTYATTEEDAKNAPTGKAAVARHALPNPKPASYKWTIKPRKDTLIQYGIVEPAFGQPGGGVEVIFTKGTDPGTVETKPEKIPDE